jgi:hypothetical protein
MNRTGFPTSQLSTLLLHIINITWTNNVLCIIMWIEVKESGIFYDNDCFYLKLYPLPGHQKQIDKQQIKSQLYCYPANFLKIWFFMHISNKHYLKFYNSFRKIFYLTDLDQYTEFKWLWLSDQTSTLGIS